jgi:hypothetical protein
MWGKRAERMLGVQLLRLAHKLPAKRAKRARRIAAAFHIQEHEQEQEEAEEDALLEVKQHGPWLATPIRSALHMCVLKLSDELEAHPWARFLAWFMETYVEEKAAVLGVFTPEQRLVRDGHYEVQLLVTSGVIVLRTSDMEESFDVHALAAKDSEDALNALKHRVMALEAAAA